MRKLSLLLYGVGTVFLYHSAAFAQTPIEAYAYGQSVATPPYGSGLRILAAPSSTASSLQTINSSTLLDLTSPQTATNKTISGGFIVSLPNPTNPQDAATKAYVDAAVTTGINHTQVAVTTVTVLPDTPTYANGASGVGATLTATSATTLTIDGHVVANGERIGVISQASQLQNGVYTATISGSPWVLTRATDMDQPVAGEMALGAFFFTTFGTVNAGNVFGLGAPTATPIVIGTTALFFNQLATSASADSVVTGITAAGSSQAGCQALSAQQNYVGTVALNTGVCLPAAGIGFHSYVCNEGANPLTAYAAAGGTTINSLGATAGMAIAVDTCAHFIGKSASAWRSVP